MPVHDFDRIVERRGGDSIKWNAYPQDVLPMWVADSDFTAPQSLVDALSRRVAQGVYGYADQRTDVVQHAVAHWMRTRFAWDAQPQWVAFAPSVVNSLALAIATFTSPGESVLFFTPSYPPFFRIPRAHGREPLTSSLTMSNDRYGVNFADLEEKLAPHTTRLFVLCNPHNPIGKVFTREELLTIGDLCLKHNVMVFADEIHCDYVFPGHRHIPFAGLSEALSARTLTAINPSKTFNVADLHASAVLCSNSRLLARFIAARNAYGLHSSAPAVTAIHTLYMQCAWYADQVNAYVKANIEHATAIINERIPGIRTTMPEATYLLWLDCRDMGLTQDELVTFFLDRAKLALNSGTDFGCEGQGFMRLNLACPRATLDEGLRRLQKAAEGIQFQS